MGVSVVSDGGFYPHAPARLYLRADARADLVRRPVAARRFPAERPQGCLPEAACSLVAGGPMQQQPWHQQRHGDSSTASQQQQQQQQQQQRHRATEQQERDQRRQDEHTPSDDSDYVRWLSQVEQELADVQNLDGDMKEQFISRADGPNYRWQNVCGAVASEYQYSSVASRAWREIATCCATLRRCITTPTEQCRPSPTSSVNRGAAIGRLRHLAEHRGPFGDPTGDQCSSICGQAPRVVAAAAVAESHNAHGRNIIQKAAVANAELIEDGLARTRLREWRQWMEGGRTRGLGRQHRFTRVAYGWTPDKSGSGSQRHGTVPLDAMEGDGGHEAGVGNGRVRVALGDDDAPMGSQATAEQQADHWAAIWAEGKMVPRPAWPSDMGPPLRRPTVEELRSAARTFPWGTGLAWDQLHPRLLDRLSDTRLEELITLLVKAEDTGEWPEAVGVVNAV
jgi:hypothetical protein